MQLVERYPTFVACLAVLVASVPAALLAGENAPLAQLAVVGVFVLGYLVFLAALSAETLFLGWLFLAPLFQDAAERAPEPGGTLVWACFVVPALVLTVRTLFGQQRDVTLTGVDFIPAAYLVFAVAMILMTSDSFQETPKVVYTTVFLGPMAYYFLRSGPGIGIPFEKIVKVLLYAATLQGVMAIINFATGRNLWDDTHWQEGYHSAFPRAVSTLSNPGVLGLFLGVAIVFAVAILSWDGPRPLRRLSIVTLVVCVPGLAMTMTRGSILAAIFAVGLVLLFGRWRLPLLVGAFALFVVLLALFPRIQATELYQGRITNEGNISARAALQDVSLQLASEKPILGWGHGSFDEEKNRYAFDSGGVPIEAVLENTSHNTYLTILVEYGIVGLILFSLPFIVVATAALPRVQEPSPERWLFIASLASLLLVVLAALTFDLRFFPFAQLLPWIFLAVLRRLLERAELEAAPAAAGPVQQ